jgi:prepilin-type processing-associated H-X9-DG protein
MEKKEATKKDSIEYLLKRILRSRHGGGSNTSFVDAPIELSASPEEGSVYKRVHRIKQPELRAAIIKLVTQMADGALTMSVQN